MPGQGWLGGWDGESTVGWVFLVVFFFNLFTWLVSFQLLDQGLNQGLSRESARS